MQDRPHIPVMLDKSLSLLNLGPDKTWIDATAGAGGHLLEILRRVPSGRVFGFDRDIKSLNELQSKLPASGAVSCQLIHANYSELIEKLHECNIDTIDGGILADLGVSSMQLDQPERGFSFQKEGPLDMRMDDTASLSAADIVNKYPERDLADIIYKYGEERLSRHIAHRIVESRPLSTTTQLSQVVSAVVFRARKGKRGADESHPATRTFQAIRMAVNGELEHLEKFLIDAVSILRPGARLAVITFHSLEDRLVKQIFRQLAQSCICPPRHPICNCSKQSEVKVLTPKPILPDAEEVLANTRSRSAKLRAVEKLEQGVRNAGYSTF